jgi:hypothetical protein
VETEKCSKEESTLRGYAREEEEEEDPVLALDLFFQLRFERFGEVSYDDGGGDDCATCLQVHQR